MVGKALIAAASTGPLMFARNSEDKFHFTHQAIFKNSFRQVAARAERQIAALGNQCIPSATQYFFADGNGNAFVEQVKRVDMPQ
jgi:hypothetical protein